MPSIPYLHLLNSVILSYGAQMLSKFSHSILELPCKTEVWNILSMSTWQIIEERHHLKLTVISCGLAQIESSVWTKSVKLFGGELPLWEHKRPQGIPLFVDHQHPIQSRVPETLCLKLLVDFLRNWEFLQERIIALLDHIITKFENPGIQVFKKVNTFLICWFSVVVVIPTIRTMWL
jgi:hypothetical protein